MDSRSPSSSAVGDFEVEGLVEGGSVRGDFDLTITVTVDPSAIDSKKPSFSSFPLKRSFVTLVPASSLNSFSTLA